MRSSTHTGIRTGRKLRVSMLCVDDSVLAHADWLSNQLARLTKNGFDFLFETQMLNPIANDDPFSEMTIRTAAESDVLVIATGSPHRREPALIQWLNSLKTWKVARHDPGLLIGLLGGEGSDASELGWLVHELIAFARSTAMDFVWQWMGEESMCDSRWLAVSLDELLTLKEGAADYEFSPAGAIGFSGV